jgi:L-ornithine N5-oxygenase
MFPLSETNLLHSVNCIFNPEFIDELYPKPSAYRANLLADARATNYGVVRLELIEHLFEVMYHQKRTLGADEKQWPHRILARRDVVSVQERGDGLRLKVAMLPAPGAEDGPLMGEEDLDVDLVICATGYKRTAHVDMLKDTWHLLPEAGAPDGVAPSKERWLVETSNADQRSTRVMRVGRDYGVRFTDGAVATGSGVWLQGCCEATHGVSETFPWPPGCNKLTTPQLSDTLLSVLSTRSGEMVQSIFGASA